MKKIIIFMIILFVSNFSYASKSLFDTDFYDIQFESFDIENKKNLEIKKIKLLTFDKILNNLLNQEDYIRIKKNLNEEFSNVFVKNIIIDDEKIISNRYSSKIKINFDKIKVIKYLRANKIPYVEYLPEKFILVIYDETQISKNLFSKKNKYYSYLLKNNNFNYLKLPNLDINDRYLLNEKDLINKDEVRIKNFSKKYNNKDLLVIISKNNKIFSYLFINQKIVEMDDHIFDDMYESLFDKLQKNSLNLWKIENQIQKTFLNNLNCDISFFNMFELKEIKRNLSSSSLIKNIITKSISLKKNNYDINFYGNKRILIDVLKLNKLNIKINDKKCKIKLL